MTRWVPWVIAVLIVASVSAAFAQTYPSPDPPTGSPGAPGQPNPPGVPNWTPPPPPRVEDGSRNRMRRSENQGPWTGDLFLRRGADGTTWGEAKVIVPAAGVPSAIRLRDGRILMAFQWFPQDELLAEWFDRVAVIVSEDGGRSWSLPEPIEVKGLPTTYQRPFDPTLAEAGDSLVRIYFSCGDRPERGSRGGMIGIATHSAISADGIHYLYETGPRFAVADRNVIDPAAWKLGETWHLTAPAGRPEEGAFHAVSRDGLSFTRARDIASVNRSNWTGNLVGVDGGMRFYGTSEHGPWWSFSVDGFRWTSPRSMDVSGGDPTVVRNTAGEWLMIYVNRSEDAASRRANFRRGAGAR